MRRFLQRTLLFLSLHLFIASAWADIAVVLNVTTSSVSVQRVQRAVEGHNPAMADAFKARRLAHRSAMKTPYPAGMLVLEALNAQGEVIHHEAKANPLRVHAPGGLDVVFPSVLVLARLPADSMWLRVKLPDLAEYFRLELETTH